jgi:hypothetical protein
MTNCAPQIREKFLKKENQQQHHLPGWASAPQSRSQILGSYSNVLHMWVEERRARRAFTWNTNATKEGWRRRLKLQTQDPGSSSYYSGSSSIYNVPKSRITLDIQITAVVAMADKPREWAWQPISRSTVLKRKISSASTVEKSTKNCEKTASWELTGAKELDHDAVTTECL